MAEPREILPGVNLVKSSLGGHSVVWRGRSIGWIHDSPGLRWNAYYRQGNGEPGLPLGNFGLEDAVRQIATKAGWPGTEEK